jgi:hypothetical protein
MKVDAIGELGIPLPDNVALAADFSFLQPSAQHHRSILQIDQAGAADLP